MAGQSAGVQPLPAPRPPRGAGYLWRILLLLQRRDRRAIPALGPSSAAGSRSWTWITTTATASQDIFYNRSDILTVSIHGHPSFAYPYFSGFADETGEGDGQGLQPQPPPAGARRGRPLPGRAGGRLQAHPRVFKPEALVVSLGLDIAKADPTGTWSLTPDGLFEVGRRIGNHQAADPARPGGGVQHPHSLAGTPSSMLTGVCAGRPESQDPQAILRWGGALCRVNRKEPPPPGRPGRAVVRARFPDTSPDFSKFRTFRKFLPAFPD